MKNRLLIYVSVLFFIYILIIPLPSLTKDSVNGVKDLIGVDTQSIIPRATIISFNNHSYIYISPNILYPLDDLPRNILPNNRDYSVLTWNYLKNIKLRFIAIYNDTHEKNLLIKDIIRWGGKITYIYHYLPFIAYEIPLENASYPAIYGFNIDIQVDHMVRVLSSYSPDLNESVPIIKNPSKWKALEKEYGRPINGSGITIGILDTGIDSNHPDFYFPNGTCKIVLNISMVPGESPNDVFGHGTHVAGIAAGTGLASHGKYVGEAPGAWLANIKVLNNKGYGYDSWIIAGIEAAVKYKINIINLSLGGGGNGDGTDPLSRAVDWAVDHGVVVVVAAGNKGPNYSTLGSPAVAKKAITVGAINKNLKIASFSSRGPTGDGRVKPDVVAPGVDIIAPLAKNSTLAKEFPNRIIKGEGGDYISLSGTSMAAPHVAGVAALILQVHRDWTPMMVKNVISSTAVSLGYNVLTEGLGLVNAYNAVKSAILVSNATFSVMLKGSYKIPYEIPIYINSLDNQSHIIISSSLKTQSLYNPNISINDELHVSSPDIIPSIGSIKTLFTLTKDIPYSLYMGLYTFKLGDGSVYHIAFTYIKTLKFEVNATYNGRYFDTLFILYNRNNPDKWILPTGYKSFSNSKSNIYKYTEWFYLPPGNYHLEAISMNSGNGDKLLSGPIFLYSENITLTKNTYRQYEFTKYYSSTLPSNYSNISLVPIAHIYGFYTSSYKPFIVYQFGEWNLSAPYKIYMNITEGDKIFFNIQYIAKPKIKIFSGSKYGIDYSNTYMTSSWIITSVTRKIELGILTRYSLSTSSTIPGSNSMGGFAIFPPKKRYTYLVLGPLYQGSRYIIYTDSPKSLLENKYFEYKYFLGFNKNMSLSFLSVLDPSYPGNNLNPLKPPYFFFSRIIKSTSINGDILNISNYLLSSLSPPQFPSGYKTKYALYFNNAKILSNSTYGPITLSIGNIAFKQGIYKLIVNASSKYPVYSSVYSKIIFNTGSSDFEPPLITEFDLNPFLSGNKFSGSITILDISGLKKFSIYASWDQGKEFKGIPFYLVKEDRYGFFNRYIYRFNGTINGDSLTFKIYLIDISGNIHEDIYYNALIKPYLYKVSFKPIIKPKYVEPGVKTLLAVDSSDKYLYGFEVYLNGSYIGNLPAEYNKISSYNITIKIEEYGIYNVKFISKPFINSMNYTLKDDIISTRLLVSEYIPESGRVSIRRDVKAGVRILYEYTHEPAPNITVVINGTKYLTNKDGYALFKLRSDKVCVDYININDIYAHNSITDISTYIAPYKTYKIIFDEVYILAGNTNLRIDVGSTAEFTLNAYYEYDKTPFKGIIYLDINGSRIGLKEYKPGMYRLDMTSDKVGLLSGYVSSIDDKLYNVTTFKTSFKSINVIFDEVIIRLYTNASGVMQVGHIVPIKWEGHYAFDGRPFNGKVYIEPYPYTSDKPGTIKFKVARIFDPLYGLKKFVSNILKISFDTLDVNVSTQEGIGYVNYIIKINYHVSKEPAMGLIKIDGKEYDIKGVFKYRISSISPYSILKFKVDVPGFNEIDKSIYTINVYNLLIYLVIIILAIIGFYKMFLKRVK